MNIYEVLRARGYTTVPESFYTYIENWKSWYDGYVKQFHRYRIWNGMKYVPCRLYSLGEKGLRGLGEPFAERKMQNNA